LNYLDIIFLIIVLIGFILGYKDGLVRKIIGLLGFIIAIGFAFELSPFAGKILTPLFNNDEYLAKFIGGITIFFLTILIFSILKRLIHPVDKVNRFLNKFLGGVSGVVQILFIISGFLLFLNIFRIPSTEDRDKSLIYSFTFNLVPWSIDFVMGTNSKVNSFLKENINTIDSLELPNPFDSTQVNGIKTIQDSTNIQDSTSISP